MGAQGARLLGRSEAPTTLEASVDGICARVCNVLRRTVSEPELTVDGQIDEATKEKTSGQFVLFEDGSRVPW